MTIRRVSRQTLHRVLASATTGCVLVGLVALRWPGALAAAVFWLELVVVAVFLFVRARREPAPTEPAEGDPTLLEPAEARLRQYKRRLRWAYLSLVAAIGAVLTVGLARHSSELTLGATSILFTAYLIIGIVGLAVVRMHRSATDGAVVGTVPYHIRISRPAERTELRRAVIVVIAAFLVVVIAPGTTGWNENLQFGSRRGWLLELLIQGPIMVAHYVVGLLVPYIAPVATRVTVALVLIKLVLDLVLLRGSRQDRPIALPRPWY